MGLERNTISGSSGGLPEGGAPRGSYREFCREQIISLTIPAHVEGVDWPGRPAGLARSGASAGSSANETAMASWGDR
jgi:hypothetical protein